MKNLIFLILLSLNAFPLAAQEDPRYRVEVDYCNNEADICEAVVIAQSGLKLRAQASFSFKRPWKMEICKNGRVYFGGDCC